MTVDLSSPESETGSTDSGMGGEDEGECEMSQVRGMRRGPSPDRQRCNKYVRALVHRDSIPGLNSPYKCNIWKGFCNTNAIYNIVA